MRDSGIRHFHSFNRIGALKSFVIGVSGASGIILAKRVLEQLIGAGHFVHLVFSKSAIVTAALELDLRPFKPRDFIKHLPPDRQDQVAIHGHGDFSAPIASGSCRIDGTLIIPCSMTTLGAIASGVADNLLRRCADVALKERFPLVLVPREAPLSAIHLENMLKLSRLGAFIFPPVPLWYAKPSNVQHLEEGIAGRVLQLIGVESSSAYFSAWGEGASMEGASPQIDVH